MTIAPERIGRRAFADSGSVAIPGAGVQHGKDPQRLLGWVFSLAWVMGNLVSFKPLRSALLVLPFFAITCFILTRFDRNKGDVRIPLVPVAFMAWVVMSYGWSSSPTDSKHQIPEYAAMLLTGLICALGLSPDGLLRSLARGSRILIVIVVISLVVSYHAATAPPALDPVQGWHGPVGGKNVLGVLMALALIAFAFEQPRARGHRLWVVAAVVLLIGSRSGAGWCVAALVVAMLLWRLALSRQNEPIIRVLLKLVAAACGFASITFLFVDLPAATGLVGKSPNFTGRTSIWTAVMDAIPQHPLAGTGFAGVWDSPAGDTARLTRAIGFRAYEAHQGYLDIALQLGVVGACLFLVILVATVFRLVPGFATGPRAEAGLLVLLLGMMLENFAESMWTGFDVILFIAVATVSLGRRDGSSRLVGQVTRPVSAELP